MQNTLTVPDWIYQGLQFIGRNDLAILGVCLAALVGMVATEVVKRKWNASRQARELEKLSKKAVTWLLVAINTVSVTAGYAYLFLSQHQGWFQSLPYIGQGTLEATGLAFVLYNVRFNKSFEVWAARLSAWAKKKDRTSDDTILNAETPVFTGSPLPAPTDPNPFEG